jgi:hypothetical protein
MPEERLRVEMVVGREPRADSLQPTVKFIERVVQIYCTGSSMSG